MNDSVFKSRSTGRSAVSVNHGRAETYGDSRASGWVDLPVVIFPEQKRIRFYAYFKCRISDFCWYSMPAKSKSNRVEFHECVKCHCIVHSKDLSTHVSECSGVENHTLSHAYVKDAVFHGVVSVATGK